MGVTLLSLTGSLPTFFAGLGSRYFCGPGPLTVNFGVDLG